jgi:hypothetical protein
MTGLNLTRAQIDDVIAYLKTLQTDIEQKPSRGAGSQ